MVTDSGFGPSFKTPPRDRFPVAKSRQLLHHCTVLMSTYQLERCFFVFTISLLLLAFEPGKEPPLYGRILKAQHTAWHTRCSEATCFTDKQIRTLEGFPWRSGLLFLFPSFKKKKKSFIVEDFENTQNILSQWTSISHLPVAKLNQLPACPLFPSYCSEARIDITGLHL